MLSARLTVAFLTLLPFACLAQYPVKPIRVVLTVSAAGDITVRALTEKMTPWLGQPFVVDIQSGAGGAQGATTVSRAAPDGYTLLYGTSSAMTLRQFLVKNTPYDTLKDFVPIAKVGEAIAGLVASTEIPAGSLAELIEHVKRNPGKVTYATTGIGSTHHLTGIVMEQMTGIKWVHVPYKTGPQSAQDLAAGRVAVGIGTLTTYKAMVDTGRVRVLTINGTSRYTEMPKVPTMAEVLPGYERPPGWMSFFAPAGTAQAIVRRLEEALLKAASDPGIQEKLLRIGVLIETLPGEKFGAALRQEFDRVEKLVRAAGIEAK